MKGKRNESTCSLMAALDSCFGILTSFGPSSMGLCTTGCYHHAWLWGSSIPLAWLWTNTYSLWPGAAVMPANCFLVVALLLRISSHQVLIPLIEKKPNQGS